MSIPCFLHHSGSFFQWHVPRLQYMHPTILAIKPSFYLLGKSVTIYISSIFPTTCFVTNVMMQIFPEMVVCYFRCPAWSSCAHGLKEQLPSYSWLLFLSWVENLDPEVMRFPPSNEVAGHDPGGLSHALSYRNVTRAITHWLDSQVTFSLIPVSQCTHIVTLQMNRGCERKLTR